MNTPTNPKKQPGARLVLTITETADALGISRTLAYELVRRGELPAIRLGRRIVVPRVQLNRLVQADDAPATTDPMGQDPDPGPRESDGRQGDYRLAASTRRVG